MSDALLCVKESVTFYQQDLCKESSFDYDSFSVRSDGFADLEIMTQNENKCTKHNHLADENRTLKQTLPRKREATNILVECVKRRDNLRNIDFTSNVPSKYPNCDCVSLEAVAILNGKIDNLESKGFKIDSLAEMKSLDCSVTGSAIESSKNSSLLYSGDSSSTPCLEVGVFPNPMEIDIAGDTLVSINSDCKSLSESETCAKSVEAFAAEHLNGLCLTDSLVSSLQTKDENSTPSKSPTIQSLFKSFPSTFFFSTTDEKVASLSNPILAVMKWKLSSITPAVIKQTVLKAGFTLVAADTTEDWIGTWGKHLKCASFKRIKSFQKVNHYPGGFHLGRKDRLWENYSKMCIKHGTEAFNFFPETFVLPADLKSLKEAWESETDKCWIVKPCASARGTGVKVIYKWSQVPKNRPFVVQRYISNPYLINGSKFDLRLYVMISSLEPLRVYVFEDGLVRFASEKYSLANKSFANRFIHLTNYSINRKSSSYSSNDDENLCQGHKWSLRSFWTYMSNSGIDIDRIQATISDMIIKTVISAEGPMCRMLKTYAKSPYNCFELFGFDIMLDKDLHPWLLEVNISPSLHTKSLLDSNVKGPLVKDMLNIAGFEVPDKLGTFKDASPSVRSRHKPPHNRWLSQEERQKHALFTYKHSEVKSDILENLTLDDLHCLMESEDELRRCGSLTRIFPTENTYKYFVYFDHIRYYNVLLNAWEMSFHHNRSEGVKLLQSLFEQKLSEENE